MTRSKRRYVSAFGFTSFELIIVMIIMGVAFLMLQNVFRPANRDQLYGEVCVNTIYGELQKHAVKALTAKSVLFGNQKLFPTRYTATIDTDRNQVLLGFVAENTGGILSTLALSGSRAVAHCRSSSYHIILTGATSSVLTFAKNYQATLTQPSRSRDRGMTGEILMQLCNPAITQCQDFYKLSIDTRVQRLSLVSCAQRSSPERCAVWRE